MAPSLQLLGDSSLGGGIIVALKFSNFNSLSLFFLAKNNFNSLVSITFGLVFTFPSICCLGIGLVLGFIFISGFVSVFFLGFGLVSAFVSRSGVVVFIAGLVLVSGGFLSPWFWCWFSGTTWVFVVVVGFITLVVFSIGGCSTGFGFRVSSGFGFTRFSGTTGFVGFFILGLDCGCVVGGLAWVVGFLVFVVVFKVLFASGVLGD